MLSIFRPADWPIATKLVIAFLIIALLPIGVITYIGQNQARDGLLQAAKLNLQNTAQRSTQAINTALNNRLNDVEQTASSGPLVKFMTTVANDRGSLGRNNPDQLEALALMQVRASAAGDAYFYVTDNDGHVWLTSTAEGSIPDGELRDIPDQIYYKEAQKGLSYISDPILLSTANGTPKIAIYFSSVVRDPINGATLGVLVERNDITDLWTLVENDKEAAGPGSFTMLVDSDGIRLADSRTGGNRETGLSQYIFKIVRTVPSTERGPYPDRYPENNFNLPSYEDPLDGVYAKAHDPATPKSDSEFFATTLAGKPAEAAYGKLLVKNWSYFVVVPQATYAAAADQFTQTALIVLLIVAILVILVALGMARLLTTPVRAITRVLGRIGIGDFDARVPVRGRDELGRLGEALNAMFDNTLTLIQTREERDTMQEQITRLLNEISTVAEGDLTIQAEVTADITGAIADSFNLMIEELRKIILNIQSATGQTTDLLDQLIYNSKRTDLAGETQASRIMGVNVSITDLNRTIQQVSEGASVSAQVAQEARANASNGGQAVTRTISSMNRIRSNVQETSKKIKRLGESSQQIGDIVKLIDDIADQTNMLALNAAIQATMAGEQGKGFSVVAEEVRRLAERSAKATREIAGLVKSIQDDTTEAVVAMEESTREVVDGSKLADEAGQALGSIERVVERLAALILNISQLSQRQSATSSGIAQSMSQIAQLTQEATQLRHESSEAVTLVARTAAELNSSVSAFRLPEATSSATAYTGRAEFGDFELPTRPNPTPFAPPVITPVGARNTRPDVISQLYENETLGAADGGSTVAFEKETAPVEPNWEFELDNMLKDDSSFFDMMLEETISPEHTTADNKKGSGQTEVLTPTGNGTPPKKGQAVG